MSVETTITYHGELHCTAVHEPSGREIATDAPIDNGGKGEAFSPTDLVTAAFGTCVMTIMGMVALRSGLDLAGTKILVSKEMASSPLRRIGTLKARFTFPKGLKLSAADRKKLEATVATCPVKQSLHPDIVIETVFVYE